MAHDPGSVEIDRAISRDRGDADFAIGRQAQLARNAAAARRRNRASANPGGEAAKRIPAAPSGEEPPPSDPSGDHRRLGRGWRERLLFR